MFQAHIKRFLIKNSDNLLNIGISAPTGKATARLKESLNKEKDIFLSEFLDQIECQTLHKWISNSYQKAIKLKFKLKCIYTIHDTIKV